MSADQLHNLIEGKPKWELAELLRALEEEFDVTLRVVNRSSSEEDRIDVQALANDPDVIRTIEASREDRKAGRVYSGQAALEMLRKLNRENEDGANL